MKNLMCLWIWAAAMSPVLLAETTTESMYESLALSGEEEQIQLELYGRDYSFRDSTLEYTDLRWSHLAPHLSATFPDSTDRVFTESELQNILKDKLVEVGDELDAAVNQVAELMHQANPARTTGFHFMMVHENLATRTTDKFLEGADEAMVEAMNQARLKAGQYYLTFYLKKKLFEVQ